MQFQASRRDFVKAIGLGVASIAVGGCEGNLLSRAGGAGAGEKPNLLFVLVDDMGWADLPCYGSEFHETPNIDRLAMQAVRFTDAYAAGAVCSPTRASILAGQYPARVGITDFIPGHPRPWSKLRVPENRLQLPLESVTIAEALKKQGYSTGYIGKWHLGGGETFVPQNQGFDMVLTGGRNRNDKRVTTFTDTAVHFLEANRDKPFFLFLSHHTVHIPLEAPQDLVEKYRNKPKAPHGVNNPAYAAMVEHLDNSMGRLVRKLDELDLTRRTVVIFFSDNGGLRQRFDGKGEIVASNAPLRDEKGTLYEGGIRVPLIVRWPGVVKPGVCNIPVTSVDFYPTILDLAGAKADPHHALDGTSIVGLIMRTGRFRRDAIFWHYPHYHHSTPAGAIREGDWKLIEFFEDGSLELYNLRDDISEKNNLAGRMPEKASRLQRRLAAWRKSVDAKMPTPNPDYDPAKADQWGKRQRRKS
ncbi:MAG: sulfatase [Phycisphaerales bacterium]|nr:MAG: sulfatase [Phycisphaerales bacterium]